MDKTSKARGSGHFDLHILCGRDGLEIRRERVEVSQEKWDARQAKRLEEAAKEEAFKNNPKNFEDEINCNRCGTFICWAYANDLNGSYFICNKCKAFIENKRGDELG